MVTNEIPISWFIFIQNSARYAHNVSLTGAADNMFAVLGHMSTQYLECILGSKYYCSFLLLKRKRCLSDQTDSLVLAQNLKLGSKSTFAMY